MVTDYSLPSSLLCGSFKDSALLGTTWGVLLAAVPERLPYPQQTEELWQMRILDAKVAPVDVNPLRQSEEQNLITRPRLLSVRQLQSL